jgi:cation transport ATPase
MPTTRLTPDRLTPEPTQNSQVQSVLERPATERIREYRYRFAQAVVFGLPVAGLELYGGSLGGTEAWRWVRFFQALLAGWVIYVGAAGMLFEGLLLLRRRVTADLCVATAAVAMYCAGWFVAGWFCGAVLLVCVWTGLRWWGGARKLERA